MYTGSTMIDSIVLTQTQYNLASMINKPKPSFKKKKEIVWT